MSMKQSRRLLLPFATGALALALGGAALAQSGSPAPMPSPSASPSPTPTGTATPAPAPTRHLALADQGTMPMPMPNPTPGPGAGSSALPAPAPGAAQTGGDAAAAPADPTYLAATLDGKSETPAASPTGAGLFKARLFVHDGKFCYTLTSSGLGTLTMAHVHSGAVGVAGPPVFTLLPSVPTETCLKIDPALAAKFASDPASYYVNIHTSDFPGGAIRGQLSASATAPAG